MRRRLAWTAWWLAVALWTGAAALAEEYSVVLPQGYLNVRLASTEENEAGETEYIYEYVLTDAQGETLSSFRQASTMWEQDPSQDGLVIADVNFDGYMDVDIRTRAADQNDARAFFLWNAQSGQFERAQMDGVQMSWYTLYPEAGVLVNRVEDSDVCYRLEMYGWDGGALRALRTAAIVPGEQAGTLQVFVVRHDADEDYPLLEGTLAEDAYLNGAQTVGEILTAAFWQGMETP